MKFTRSSSDGFGSSHTQVNFENFRQFNKEYIQYREIFRPSIRQAADFESDKSPKLETMWWYYIFYNGVELYQFHSSKEFTLSELDISPTDHELRDVVKISHKHLQLNFEQRRVEFPQFDPIPDISDNSSIQNIPELREVLLNMQDSL